MKKILYIVSTLKRSGPTSQLYNIIKGLDRDIFDPYLITLSPESNDSRWQDYKDLGVNLHTLSLSRIAGLFFAKSKLIKLLDIIQPHLIHTQGIRSDVLTANIARLVPHISTIRNFPKVDYEMTYGKIQGSLMVSQHVRAIRKVSQCVGVSTAVSENLEKQHGVSNVSTIRNGVDSDIFFPCDKNVKEKIRSELRLPHEKKIWISSGHLSDRKDPLAVLRAFIDVYGNNAENIFVLIGGGGLEEQCRNWQVTHKNILVRGRVNNVASYLRASDYYVSAAKSEGMPNALLEGLSCGLPVILSNIGPHKEIIALSPDCGLLYKLGSNSDMIDAFVKIGNENASQMSKAALRLVECELSAESMSKKYQSIYSNLLEALQ